jgi:hypothetical protein
MKRIEVSIWLGLMIVVLCSFLGVCAETVVPVLSVGDRWSYGWFNGEFTNATGEVGGHRGTISVDRIEDFKGVSCYVLIYENVADQYENFTETVWMTQDWVILKTEDYLVYPEAETIITFVWSPGMKLYDFPLTVGKEWSDRSYRTIEQTWWEGGSEETWTGEMDYFDWSRKVVAAETVTVPAGTFDTYVVEIVGNSNLMMWLGDRFYFSPDAKNYVKAEGRGEYGGGEVLTSYELAPTESEQGDFSEFSLPIALTISFGILGCAYFFISRRERKPWNND